MQCVDVMRKILMKKLILNKLIAWKIKKKEHCHGTNSGIKNGSIRSTTDLSLQRYSIRLYHGRSSTQNNLTESSFIIEANFFYKFGSNFFSATKFLGPGMQILPMVKYSYVAVS